MNKLIKILNKDRILENIVSVDKKYIKNFLIYDEIDSTNDEAKKRINESKDLHDDFAIFAEKQLSGRGRGGKIWFSPPRLNIYLSYAWNSLLKPSQLEGLSLSMGVNIATNLNDLLHLNLKVKWPNDIYLQKKKVGGILIETIKKKDLIGIIVGVGINVFMSKEKKVPIEQEWTSLDKHLTKQPDRNQLAGIVLGSIVKTKNDFEKYGFKYFKEDFEKLSLLNNQNCLVKINGKNIKGVVKGINQRGELIFYEEGNLHTLRSGEVSIKF